MPSSEARVTVDFVHPSHDLSKYGGIRPVAVPARRRVGRQLARYVEGGGTLACRTLGIVDEHDTVPRGPFPGMLRMCWACDRGVPAAPRGPMSRYRQHDRHRVDRRDHARGRRRGRALHR
ncbi:beta-galactosidase trimerization domain-containing protein, partial [Agromyces flavus]|uniref:beta-galactosidase trimerization domain-containing protein n=1 Tax=Agromyces flavus TaxID=589382 RepID=UPI00361C8213